MRTLFDDLYGPQRIVGEGVVAALERDRLDLNGERNDPDVFRRVWPPSPDGTIAGNALGFLRYLTRDPASALRVECALGYSLTLDRSVTAPNAVIGVAFGKPAIYRSAWMFMFPGDTIHVPGGFNKFFIFNADDVNASIATSRPFGYCGFIVGTRPNGQKPDQSSVRPASAIFGLFGTDGSLIFSRGRVRTVMLIAQSFTDAGLVQLGWQAFVTVKAVARSMPSAPALTALDSETMDNAVVTFTGASIPYDQRWLAPPQNTVGAWTRIRLPEVQGCSMTLSTAVNATNVRIQVTGAD